MSTDTANGARCALCRHFDNDPRQLERALPGMSSLSSGHGTARAQDGLCALHQALRSARSGCAGFSPIARNDMSEQAVPHQLP